MPLGGGIEKYTEEVGARLVARGHDVVVYAMRHCGARNGMFRGMRIKTIPSLKSRSLEKMTAAFMGHFLQCFEPDIDVVHAHAFGPSMFCLFPRMMGRKVVVQGHGIEWMRSRWSWWGKLILKLTEAPSVKLSHALTVVSKVQKEYIQIRYNKNSIYIPTGVNPPTLETPQLIKQFGLAGNDYILFAARLVREKGVHYLLDAYNRLQTNMKLVIAGDVQHEEHYKSELYKLADGNKNIIFTGFATGKLLHELFSNCYVFVLPSEIEGLSTALLEAMSYGNCCLISDIPENREALNGFGYTFRNQDAVDLRKKLSLLLADHEAVERYKIPARDYVLRNFSWDDIAVQFEKLYLDILKSGGNQNHVANN